MSDDSGVRRRTVRDGRNIPWRCREATLELKEFEMGRKTEPIVIDAIREEVQFSVGEGPMDGKFVRTPVAFHVYASLEKVMEDGETRIIG